MTDDNLKTKRTYAQSQTRAPVIPNTAIQSSHTVMPVQMDSQQQLILNQPIGPIYTNIQQQQQHSMRTTAASSNSSSNYDNVGSAQSQAMSTGRKPMQDTYVKHYAVSSQYYPQMAAAPPMHATGQSVPFTYNQVYTGTQANAQQNVVPSSFMTQLYPQSAHHSLFPHMVTTSTQNPWTDAQSTMQQVNLAQQQTEANPLISHPNTMYHMPTQQQVMGSTLSYSNTVVLPRSRSDRPVEKLSLALIETYKKINEVYFEERRRRHDRQHQ